MPRSESNPRPL